MINVAMNTNKANRFRDQLGQLEKSYTRLSALNEDLLYRSKFMRNKTNIKHVERACTRIRELLTDAVSEEILTIKQAFEHEVNGLAYVEERYKVNWNTLFKNK